MDLHNCTAQYCQAQNMHLNAFLYIRMFEHIGLRSFEKSELLIKNKPDLQNGNLEIWEISTRNEICKMINASFVAKKILNLQNDKQNDKLLLTEKWRNEPG